jgi:hypothetical protein
MLAIAGTIAYDATLLVHFFVGYTDPLHLAPAFGGLALLWLALALLFPYLMARDASHIAAWDKLLSGPLRDESEVAEQEGGADD